MYLNTQKENTNIDNQFKSRKKFDLSKMKVPLIISIVILVLLITIIVVVIALKNATKYFLTLEGDENIKLYAGTTYVEPGYTGFDNKKNNFTSEVEVTTNLDLNKVGEYQIVYKFKNITKTRNITVVEKSTNSPTTTIYLIGYEELTLPLGETYEEKGYNAIDTVDSDITNKVKVYSNINTNKAGEYYVVYTVTNSQGITTTNMRKVTVK